jgi:integral membrane sensor domain MASE1
MTAIIIPVYICAIVASVFALVLAIFLSNNVAYKPNLSDVRKRKAIFWFSSIVAPVVSALLAYLFVYLDLKTGSKKSTFMLHMFIGLAVSWIVYVILGFVVSKVNKQGKLGSWF